MGKGTGLKSKNIEELTNYDIENIIYKSIHYYNGFLDIGYKIKVEENMMLNEYNGIDETHFLAILILVETYFMNNFKIELDIEHSDVEIFEYNSVVKLAEFLKNKISNMQFNRKGD